MTKLSNAIVKQRWLILILAVLLLIPSLLGIISTRINYDMLDYLPKDIETVKGQDILMDEFGKGAFSLIVVEGMDDNGVADLKSEIEKVEHVDTVLWYNSVADLTVPKEILPDKIYSAFNSGDATMVAVFFDTSTSADETMDAITKIRNLSNKQVFVSGMSAMVTDLKALCEREEPIYVGLAVLLSCIAMMITLDNWLAPFVFLASIGMAILYNLGSNYFLGEISYITKALAAVLQLGVTMDYSIFLWHSYEEQKSLTDDKKAAMSNAITATITSVTGSSITTIAGFIALCFMSYTMGLDLGVVMAKGVLLGVIGSVTILPSLILILDKPMSKFNHRSIIPNMDKLAGFVTKHYVPIIIAFVIILVPALYGYTNTKSYYDLAKTLTVENGLSAEDVRYSVANSELNKYFDVSTTEMVLCDADMTANDAKNMLNEIEDVDGVMYALGINSVLDGTVPEETIPKELISKLKSDKHQLILVNSKYSVASDEANEQITKINKIIKQYDSNAMLIGEAPCTKDLIQITNHDFSVVDSISIIAIFIIILIVLKSVSLPVILVAVIEFAIFINLGIPCYTGTELPFIAPICINTIQLGATVDYAILMTTRYKKERIDGHSKIESVQIALSTSIPSIIVSAFGFFAATAGVALYSNIDIISSLCTLMARGAIISMISVIFVLPSMFMLFDKIVCKSTLDMHRIHFGKKGEAKS